MHGLCWPTTISSRARSSDHEPHRVTAFKFKLAAPESPSRDSGVRSAEPRHLILMLTIPIKSDPMPMHKLHERRAACLGLC
jgi:hypothetical protein